MISATMPNSGQRIDDQHKFTWKKPNHLPHQSRQLYQHQNTMNSHVMKRPMRNDDDECEEEGENAAI